MSYIQVPVSVPGPTRYPTIPNIYTDFTDTDLWRPAATRGLVVTPAAGGVTIAGNADDPASSIRYIQGGVIGQFLIFPQADGNIEIEAVFDSYVRATDLNNSDDWIFCIGFMGEMDRYAGDPFTFAGYGGLSGAGQDFAAHGVVASATSNITYFAVYTTAGVATTFSINFQVENIVWPPGSVRLKGSHWFEVIGDGGVGSLGGAVPAVNAQMWGPGDLNGFRPMIGVVANENSQIASARCTSFTVNRGVVLQGV